MEPISEPKLRSVKEPKRCGAKTRNGGTPCKNWGMLNGRCRMHGGKSLKGRDAPAWKHGRYTKYLPKGLMDRYEAEKSDPELLVLNDEIALVRSRLSMLLEKIETAPDSGSTWRDLRTSLRKFEQAQRSAANFKEGPERDRKMKEVAQLFDYLRMLINRGVAEWAAWGEIMALMDQVRRLTESEQKRRVAGEHILHIQDVIALFDYTVKLIDDVVSDPKEKTRLSEGLYKLSRRMDGKESLVE